MSKDKTGTSLYNYGGIFNRVQYSILKIGIDSKYRNIDILDRIAQSYQKALNVALF